MSSKKVLTEADIERFLQNCDDDFNFLGSSEEDDDSNQGGENNEEEQAPVAGDDVSLSSEFSEEELSDEDDIPLNMLRSRTNVIDFSKTILRGKNFHKWSTKKGKSHHRAMNYVHKARGSSRECKGVVDPLECFKLFITSEIVDEIVQWTNVEIQNRQKSNSQMGPTDLSEIYALLGLLVLTAIKKDNHLTTDELFDPTYCGSRYLASMGKFRFKFLMSCLRFDDKSVRLRLINDKFAPIRKVWDLFIQKCRQNYVSGLYLTIDEQLLAFRGHCPFRMYIPNKPAKFGLKLVMLCDSGTKYMVDASPYLGKGSNPTAISLGEYYVKELTKTVHGTNRNITMDTWFTSVPLAKSLLSEPYKLTIIGTLRSNKREIPKEMGNVKGRKAGTSMFCYDNELTLLSYKPKPNKFVYLLSSCNEEGTINMKTGKPHMVEFYNQTKGGVDTLDQMCSVVSCSRKTNRWPMCLFFGILNITFVNSYVIYTHNMLHRNQKPKNRRQYLKDLHESLVVPFLRDRHEKPTLQTSIKESIENIIPNPQEGIDNADKGPKKRRICHFCPSSKRRMTKATCNICKKSICGEHKVELCVSCREKAIY